MDKKFAEGVRWFASLNEDDRAAYIEVQDTGMLRDYFNEYGAFNIKNLEALLDHLQPIPTFAEYLDVKFPDPKMQDYILKKSSPEKVRQINALAAEFNAAIPRMQAERDVETLRGFYPRAMAIMNAKK